VEGSLTHVIMSCVRHCPWEVMRRWHWREDDRAKKTLVEWEWKQCVKDKNRQKLKIYSSKWKIACMITSGTGVLKDRECNHIETDAKLMVT
jgi:hypothetical protein